MTMTSESAEVVSSSTFWRCFLSLASFSYWSKFYVYISTGSGFITIYFYIGLTINPEIGNTPAWVLPNIWRLGRVRNTEFGTDVSNEMPDAVKCQGYSFYGFWVIKGKSTKGGDPSSIPRFGLSICIRLLY